MPKLKTPPKRKPMKRVVGIDPGAKGAAVLLAEGEVQDYIRFTKYTDREILDRFETWAHPCGALIPCYLEKVSSAPGQGVASVFKFGVSYGKMQAMVMATGMRLEFVTPKKWLAATGVPKVGVKGQRGFTKNTAEKKKATRERAQQLYPGISLTTDVWDALMIAHYGWLQR